MATDNAYFAVSCEALPADATVVSYSASERVSDLFDVYIDFFTEDVHFDHAKALHSNVTLTVTNDRRHGKYYRGVVFQIDTGRAAGPLQYYTLRVRPKLALLELTQNSRVFQHKNLQQIATDIFEEHDIDEHVEWRLIADVYHAREYFVQYEETDLNFVNRMFEEFGIFYFFVHDEDKSRLVITDDPQGFERAPSALLSLVQGAASQAEPIESFGRQRRIRPNKVLLRDYDDAKPQIKPMAELGAEEAWQLTRYEYPARIMRPEDAPTLARARLRELRADFDTCQGSSRSVNVRLGNTLMVIGAAEDNLVGEFIVTELFSEGLQNPEDAKGNFACHNKFIGIPVGVPYAAKRRARRPRISGVQTAFVTGPSGNPEAIHTDARGRVKIRFVWDRNAPNNEQSSCWVRVAQVLSGGSIITPRIGWEVAVSFLEGDPDKPVVLGRVYNAVTKGPEALPANKTRGGYTSHSSTGGDGINCLTFEDAAGKQLFAIKAQKDLNVVVQHDSTEVTKGNEHEYVHTSQALSVIGNESATVKGNESVSIGGSAKTLVTKKQTHTIKGNDTVSATANWVENVTKDRKYTVKKIQMRLNRKTIIDVTGDYNRKVDMINTVACLDIIREHVIGNFTSNVGAATVHVVKGEHAETVAEGKKQTSLAAELHVSKKGFTTESDGNITHLVGGLHYRKLDGDLTVKGKLVVVLGAIGDFNAGGTQVKLGGGPITIKGSKIKVQAALIIKLGASLKLA